MDIKIGAKTMSETIKDVAFPQPEVTAPTVFTKYHYAQCGDVIDARWGHIGLEQGSASELSMLELGGIYLDREACKQRIAYDAQQMARLVIPAWFRALGPDVEIKQGSKWGRFPLDAAERWVGDWSQERPENYRAKPREVVSVVNGREFRWPVNAKPNDPIGDRFLVQVVGLGAIIGAFSDSGICGNRTHHTRSGAQAQVDALNAFLAGAL